MKVLEENISSVSFTYKCQYALLMLKQDGIKQYINQITDFSYSSCLGKMSVHLSKTKNPLN